MDEVVREQARKIISLKQEIDKLLLDARFLDTVGVSGVADGMSATAFLSPDKKQLLLTLLNPKSERDDHVSIAPRVYHLGNVASCELMTCDEIGRWR